MTYKNKGKPHLREVRAKQKAILNLFECYALHVRDWEPSKEEDWEGIKDSIFVLLYEDQHDV